MPGVPALGPDRNVGALGWKALREKPARSETLLARTANLARPDRQLLQNAIPQGNTQVQLLAGPPLPTLRYRDVELTLDPTFYTEYVNDLRGLREQYATAAEGWDDLSHGLVSSVGDTLDVLWWRIKLLKGDFQKFSHLVSCWNLHQDDPSKVEDYSFWCWGWGAPHKLHMWTCQMLYSTADYVDYNWTPGTSVPDYADECIGLAGYIRSALMGGSPKNRANEDCYLSFAFRSDGSSHDLVNDWCEEQKNKHLACDEPWARESEIPDCVGTSWDNWEGAWIESANCAGNGKTGLCAAPDTGCASANGRHNNYSIHLHAITLAYDGYVCDHIMFLARMAMDYGRWLESQGRSTEAMQAEVAADLISRYALRIMAERCRLLIHEIGHAWLWTSPDSLTYWGSHCEYNCCNDIAQTHWWCWVRAALGLPYQVYQRVGLYGDYDPAHPTMDYVELDPCSGDIEKNGEFSQRAYHVWRCTFSENGRDGLMPTGFCSTGCLSGYPVNESGSGSPEWFKVVQTGEWRVGWEDFCR